MFNERRENVQFKYKTITIFWQIGNEDYWYLKLENRKKISSYRLCSDIRKLFRGKFMHAIIIISNLRKKREYFQTGSWRWLRFETKKNNREFVSNFEFSIFISLRLDFTSLIQGSTLSSSSSFVRKKNKIFKYSKEDVFIAGLLVENMFFQFLYICFVYLTKFWVFSFFFTAYRRMHLNTSWKSSLWFLILKWISNDQRIQSEI